MAAAAESCGPPAFAVAHLVPVVEPSVGAGHDDHPVLPTVRLLGGEGGGQAETQPETQPEQGGEDRLVHAARPRCVWTPGADDGESENRSGARGDNKNEPNQTGHRRPGRGSARPEITINRQIHKQ